MLQQLITGPQTVADSAYVVARGGRNGETITSDLHGSKYEQTLRGNVFGITGGLTTTTAAGAGTFTGLLVGNPVGSGINLVLHKAIVLQGAAVTAETNIGIMYGPSTLLITASLATIFNRNPAGAASKCVATAGQTITAPTAFIVFCGSGSGAITVPGLMQPNVHDLDGSLVLPPGYFVASYTSRVSTTALMFGFQWEEVPI